MNQQSRLQEIKQTFILNPSLPYTWTRDNETVLPAPRPVKIVHKIEQPQVCSICQGYLSTSTEYNGSGCTDPSHWQAAGLLKANDYYQMAQLAAKTRAKQR